MQKGNIAVAAIGLALLAIGLSAVTTTTAGELDASSNSPAEHFVVSARDYSFSPAYPTIAAGTQVTWVNRDQEAHTVTSDVGLFDAEVGPGERFSYTFDEAGSYFYFCQPHDWMIGEVTVEPVTLAAAAALSQSEEPPDQRSEVVMLGYEFQPISTTIRVGGIVTWTNFDAEPHTATAVEREIWSTAPLAGGESESVTFAEPGTYPYLCDIHPSMQGEIIVLFAA